MARIDPVQDALGGMVCAVCARVLYEVRHSSGEHVAWTHSDTLDAAEDHPAIPVRRGTVPTDGRCDFCNATDQVAWLPVDPFEYPAPPGTQDGPVRMSGDGWAACAGCAVLVADRSWYQLVLRVRREQRARGERYPPVVYEHMMELYRRLDAHIAGPFQPL